VFLVHLIATFEVIVLTRCQHTWGLPVAAPTIWNQLCHYNKRETIAIFRKHLKKLFELALSPYTFGAPLDLDDA